MFGHLKAERALMDDDGCRVTERTELKLRQLLLRKDRRGVGGQ